MRYLLDVSALVALGVVEHEFHDRATAWVDRTRSNGGGIELLTCSITEIGFVRVLSQTALYGFTVPTARALLLRMKAQMAAPFGFISDSHDISRLPGWVKTPKLITDGHLLHLAEANDAVLATLDRKIPGAFLIPQG
jgi:predicted nucleic acid-binding protein